MTLLNDVPVTTDGIEWAPVASPVITGPTPVEGVTVSSLPGTGTGPDDSGLAFGLLLALLMVALIAGSYGAAAWVRGRELS